MPPFLALRVASPDVCRCAEGVLTWWALWGITTCGRHLGALLPAVDAASRRSNTDVLVLSDHGCSTISRRIELAEILKQAGFHATREFKSPPASGDIMVAGNGGAALLYVTGRQMDIIRRLVEFLQGQDFTGVLFTREKIDGTFSLEQAQLDSPDCPDVLV